jgi:HSP20 family protein
MLPMVRRNWFGSTFDEPATRLRSEVDTLFDRFFGGDGGSLAPAWTGVPVAMWEDEDHIYIEAELPGATEKDIDVTVHNGLLFIRGERRPVEGRNYLYNGRLFGRFERVITLPEAVDAENVQARLADGLLSIELSKSPAAKPKKVTVVTK